MTIELAALSEAGSGFVVGLVAPLALLTRDRWLMAVAWFLVRPAIADTSDAARSRFSAGVGITHLGLVVGLVLMIWKPGT